MAPSRTTSAVAVELTAQAVAARIVTLRGVQVLLDSQLADMYAVETKALNRAVKRNTARFPASFCFQLTAEEWADLRFQFGTSSAAHGGRRYLRRPASPATSRPLHLAPSNSTGLKHP